MKVTDLLRWKSVVPPSIQLELYPFFLFSGAKVRSLSDDFRRLQLEVPVRWYNRNMHGSLFGGIICGITDPLAALLCERIFPGVDVWTKSHSVEFRKPTRVPLDIRLEITDEVVQSIEKALAENGKTVHLFEYPLLDQRGHTVAFVKNGVFIRRKIKK